MELSVIISTYKSPLWLEKVLIGYCQQVFQSFEIIVAEDACDEETKGVVQSFVGKLNIKHVTQQDVGFRKNRILNQAIMVSEAPYLVFTDGDCIPRRDFLQTHFERRREKHFLSGGYFKLPMSLSKVLSDDNIVRQQCFDLSWLKANGIGFSIKNWKISSSTSWANFLNNITPTKATWNGHNSSGWKKDILSVNGFNEDMGYGGEDRELGERLMNSGIKGIQIRYSAICVHLEHEREYVKQTMLMENIIIRKETKRSQRIWTEMGIMKY